MSDNFDNDLSGKCRFLEEDLFKTKQLLDLLMDSNPFSIFWKDKDLVYRGCNKKFVKISGFSSPEEVFGKTDYDMPWGVDNEIGAEACRSSDQRIIDSGVAEMHIIEQIKQKDGVVVWTDTNKVPILDRDGNVTGVLCVLEDITQRKMTEKALEDANKELDRLSKIDVLTQVPNRRYFTEQLQREWSRAKRHQAEMACIMFDVDHFKKFNDEFGHLIGDECLRHVADTASRVLKRPTDIIARYGGEEFIIILPSVGAEGATIVAEDIRKRIEALRLETSRGMAGVTASFGVFAGFPLYLDSPEALIASADKALYQAKDSGRNMVVKSDA